MIKITDKPKKIRAQVPSTMLSWWRWKLTTGISVPPEFGPRKDERYWCTMVTDSQLYKSLLAFCDRENRRYLKFVVFREGLHMLLPDYHYFNHRRFYRKLLLGNAMFIPVLSTCRAYFAWLWELNLKWPEIPDDEPMYNAQEIKKVLGSGPQGRAIFDPCEPWVPPSERAKRKVSEPVFISVPEDEVDFSEQF